MQQQPEKIYDLKEVCGKSHEPCRRDGTTVEVSSRVFGRLRISRCCALDGVCGELFIYQFVTGHEMPLHVLRREDAVLADLCWNAYRMALQQENRGDAMITLGGIAPIIMDL